MRVKGICSVTQREETIDFKAIPCGTFDNPNAHLKGLMLSCSAMGSGECPRGECSIYSQVPDEFNIPHK